MQAAEPSHYFARRAEEERAAAHKATSERAARSHRELADHYSKRATGAEQPCDDAAEEDAGILPKEFRIVP